MIIPGLRSKGKKRRLVLILTGIAFLAGAADSFDNGAVAPGTAGVAVALFNIAGAFIVYKHPFRTRTILNSANALFAAVSAIYYFHAGRAIWLGWLLVSAVYATVLIVSIRKRRQANATDIQ
jgi:hypothetical protein